jgi:hypothetical protein
MQSVRMQSLPQDRRSLAVVAIDPGDGAQAPGLLKMNFIFKMPGWYSELAVGARFESSADYFMSLPLFCN